MKSILEKFNLTGELSGAGTGSWLQCHGEELVSISPIDGQSLGTVRCAAGKDYEDVVSQAVEAFEYWRLVPAPRKRRHRPPDWKCAASKQNRNWGRW